MKKNSKLSVGIVGLGYVGSAVASSYPGQEILVNDPKYPKLSIDIKVLKFRCSAIFVCVPTPSMPSGECNTSILESVIKSLEGYKGIVICKSTAPPLFYKELESRYDLKLAHVPEFLTQSRAIFDYLNPHKILVGCKKKLRKSVTEILTRSVINFDKVEIEYCSIAEASFFKYMTNNLLAIKVIVNNEFYDLASAMGLDWTTLTSIAKTDHRLGSTHWTVPGTDGNRGFGGACFPKDTEAFQYLGNQYAVDLSVLRSVIKKNKSYRKE